MTNVMKESKYSVGLYCFIVVPGLYRFFCTGLSVSSAGVTSYQHGYTDTTKRGCSYTSTDFFSFLHIEINY